MRTVPPCMTPVVVVPRAEPRESLTTTVGHVEGHEEEPLSPVWRADVRSLRQRRRHAETSIAQISDDCVEAGSQMTAHVLADDEPRAALARDAQHVGPEVPRVVDALAMARDGEGLAGVARSDEIHRATPRATVERPYVVPERSRIHPPRLHSRDQRCGGIGFPLHMSDGAEGGGPSLSEGESRAKLEGAGSATEGDSVDGGRYSHVTGPPLRRGATARCGCARGAR